MARMQNRTKSTAGTLAARLAAALAIVAWLGIPLAIAGRLAGLWSPLGALEIGFGILIVAALLALVSALAGLWFGRRAQGDRPAFRRSMIAGIGALLILLFPGYWINKARSVPPIHDISTDTADPPRFSAVLADRAAENAVPATYDPKVAALQKAAYPDIVPLLVAKPQGETFVKALAAAKAMGWRIDAAEAETGRIEATDITRWIGFRDDISVRVSPADGGRSRVDVRSLSRQGRSDIGANAARIRAYLRRLRQEVG